MTKTVASSLRRSCHRIGRPLHAHHRPPAKPSDFYPLAPSGHTRSPVACSGCGWDQLPFQVVGGGYSTTVMPGGCGAGSGWCGAAGVPGARGPPDRRSLRRAAASPASNPAVKTYIT